MEFVVSSFECLKQIRLGHSRPEIFSHRAVMRWVIDDLSEPQGEAYLHNGAAADAFVEDEFSAGRQRETRGFVLPHAYQRLVGDVRRAVTSSVEDGRSCLRALCSGKKEPFETCIHASTMRMEPVCTVSAAF